MTVSGSVNESTTEALNEKQAAFVEEYLKTGSAAIAAQNAGYSARAASSLMATESVRQAIRGATQVIAAEVGVDRESLIKRALDTYNSAKASGNEAGQVQALRLLAELTGAHEAPPPVEADAPESNREQLTRALFDFVLASGKALGGVSKNEGGGGSMNLLSNGSSSDDRSPDTLEIIDPVDGGTVISITDPKQIAAFDAQRAALDPIPAKIKNFSNGFSWRKRYDQAIRRDVYDLFDSAGSLCGTRQSRERADKWCEDGGKIS
jgi:hypothetical protein